MCPRVRQQVQRFGIVDSHDQGRDDASDRVTDRPDLDEIVLVVGIERHLLVCTAVCVYRGLQFCQGRRIAGLPKDLRRLRPRIGEPDRANVGIALDGGFEHGFQGDVVLQRKPQTEAAFNVALQCLGRDADTGGIDFEEQRLETVILKHCEQAQQKKNDRDDHRGHLKFLKHAVISLSFGASTNLDDSGSGLLRGF